MTTEVKTKAGEAEWWANVPSKPKKEPTLAAIELPSPKTAKRFAEVLLRLCDATAPEVSAGRRCSVSRCRLPGGCG